jgi:chromosome partitioning protein
VEETTLGLRSNASHFTARDEVKALIDALKLPMDERGKRRAAARAEWAASADKPLDTQRAIGRLRLDSYSAPDSYCA